VVVTLHVATKADVVEAVAGVPKVTNKFKLDSKGAGGHGG
jgi:hypothetical protein